MIHFLLLGVRVLACSGLLLVLLNVWILVIDSVYLDVWIGLLGLGHHIDLVVALSDSVSEDNHLLSRDVHAASLIFHFLHALFGGYL